MAWQKARGEIRIAASQRGGEVKLGCAGISVGRQFDEMAVRQRRCQDTSGMEAGEEKRDGARVGWVFLRARGRPTTPGLL